MAESKNLRDALLSRLSTLPGTRRFHVHVLVSSPRKHTGLYPFVQPHPKTYLQDILVLVSEQRPVEVEVDKEVDKEDDKEDDKEGEKGWGPRVFVSAIEASLYTLPTTSSAILYISKVDSTGQSSHPSPTRTLALALLAFYTDPKQRPASVRAERVWVHLFARAQGQYLFPNSAEWEGKRVLGDVGLCRWWKRVFEEVGGEVGVGVNLFYVLPGMSELEASQSMGVSTGASSSSSSSLSWHYGHPYSQTDIPLPCPPNADSHSHTQSQSQSSDTYNLGRYIPSFDDDPKARFIDELAYTTEADGIRSPERKRQKTGSDRGKRDEEGSGDKVEKEGKRDGEGHVAGELRKVSREEFWERMSFRQECLAGAITGFFTMAVTSAVTSAVGEGWGVAAETGQVSLQMKKRVLASLMTGHEFSSVERARWSTGRLEGTIRGLCEGLGSVWRGGGDGSLDRYYSDIYGSVGVCNGGGARVVSGRGGVRVLSARKKKKRCDV